MNFQMRNFEKRLASRIEKYEFEVGILDDAEYKEALPNNDENPNVSSYAGGPVRKKSRQGSGKNISNVFVDVQTTVGIDLLGEPFQDESSEIKKFTNQFLKLVFNKSYTKRVENLLQAVVRNPILRGEDGVNSNAWAKEKGFNRFLIDTGQTFKAIKARVLK